MPKASMLRETAKIKTAAKLMLPTPFPPFYGERTKMVYVPEPALIYISQDGRLRTQRIKTAVSYCGSRCVKA